ncbi:hypothetical protein [Leptolyngbya sp. PCC 6406]|uniref:hypothetical protein n=1 Tax=Leptolyngbya sp. PCC 6406 TaxID=1173264 RepID=UPI0006861B80|nr:hypothetical protein [Leptolyngbya sp. PCC 6406]
MLSEGGGEFLLLDGGNDGGFGFGDASQDLLGGLRCVGGLVVGAEPADVAVAFFFGPLGVEGDEAFEDDVVEVLPLIPGPSPWGRRGIGSVPLALWELIL